MPATESPTGDKAPGPRRRGWRASREIALGAPNRGPARARRVGAQEIPRIADLGTGSERTSKGRAMGGIRDYRPELKRLVAAVRLLSGADENHIVVSTVEDEDGRPRTVLLTFDRQEGSVLGTVSGPDSAFVRFSCCYGDGQRRLSYPRVSSGPARVRDPTRSGSDPNIDRQCARHRSLCRSEAENSGILRSDVGGPRRKQRHAPTPTFGLTMSSGAIVMTPARAPGEVQSA